MENEPAERRPHESSPPGSRGLDDPDHDDPRLEEVGDEGSMPGELVDSPQNMPGDQPEDQRPPSPTTPGYRTADDEDDEDDD